MSFNLLVSGLNDSSALRWLHFKKIVFPHFMHVTFHFLVFPLIFTAFFLFLVVEVHSLHDARRWGGFEEYFLVAPRFHRHFFSYFTAIYIPVIHQSSSTAVRYAEF